MKIQPKMVAAFIIVATFFVYSGTQNAKAFSGQGSGTPEDPFQITDCEQLQEMQDGLSDSYILERDIDCSDSVDWNDGAGFLSIGGSGDSFGGSFDGQEHTISNLYFNDSNSSDAGLFGSTIDASISNLGLVAVDISAEENVGGLIGSGSADISNCYVTGSVVGEENVGGLVGYFQGGSISDCHSTATVTAEFYNGGGLVGALEDGEMVDSYATGLVEGGDFLGGLAGYSQNSLVGSCYATGKVLGNSDFGSEYIGGLIGYTYLSDTANCYATGDVSGDDQVGGLIGMSESSIEKCYATGDVLGENSVGGLVGDLSTEGDIYVYSSFSTGMVTGSGENVGGFLGFTYSDYSNCGWIVQDGLDAIGGSWAGEELLGVAELEYNETDENVFFDREHAIYSSYGDAQWDFVDIWEDWPNNFPTLRGILADDHPSTGDDEEIEEEVEVAGIVQLKNAKIDSWKAFKYQDNKGSCREKLRIVIKGRNFSRETEVRIGNKKASSISKRSSREIVAKFCLTKLLEIQTSHKRKVYVKNPGTDAKEASKRINLDNIAIDWRRMSDLSGEYFNPGTVEGVMNIQRRLSQLGFLDSQYITGNYGLITTQAVKKFQQDKGIEPTGTVGPITRNKLVEK